MAKRVPKEPVVKLTSGDLVQRLRARYDDTGRWSVLEQLANGTGFRTSSWIDVAIVSLWPSDGLGIDAYEIKVSRSDFLREVLDPSKNKWCRDHLNSFSYCVASSDIAKEDELPEGAGLFVAHGDGLKVVRAPKRFNRESYSPALMAALARASKKSDTADERLARQAYYRSDATYQSALAWRVAGEAFLTKRGLHRHSMDTASESLAAAFEQAALDDRQRETKERVERRLESFRNRMLELFGNFAQLAECSLMETDEAGHFVLDAWGGTSKDVARGRFAKRKAQAAATEEQLERAFMAEVAEWSAIQRARPVPGPIAPELCEDLDTLPALEVLPFRDHTWHKSSLRGELPRQPPPVEALAKVLDETNHTTREPAQPLAVVTKPLTAPQNQTQPGICHLCGTLAKDCSCPPQLP